MRALLAGVRSHSSSPIVASFSLIVDNRISCLLTVRILESMKMGSKFNLTWLLKARSSLGPFLLLIFVAGLLSELAPLDIY